jgi:hypothetical protein
MHLPHRILALQLQIPFVVWQTLIINVEDVDKQNSSGDGKSKLNLFP